MQPTTTPITERSVAIVRKHARQPHSASRHQASRHHPGQSATQRQAGQSARLSVLEAFRAMARGVATAAAEEQTRSFYRSSGQEWAHSLTASGGSALRARVVDAFRGAAYGVQDAEAHAKTLHFYRSSGQGWATNLG